MIIVVGVVTTRKGHKVHRVHNGWAACGAGRLIAPSRHVNDGDQLCQRCAPHLHTAMVWEVDDMRRRGNLARVAMLETFRDSGLSMARREARRALIDDVNARITASLERQAQPRIIPVPDPYAGTLTLF